MSAVIEMASRSDQFRALAVEMAAISLRAGR